MLETSINGAKGVLVNVTGSMDIGLDEVEQAATLVQQAAHPDANIIFGATFDEAMEDEIRVTVIATGFDESTGKSTMTEKPFTEAEKKWSRLLPRRRRRRRRRTHRSSQEPASVSSGDAEDDPFDAIFNIFNKRQ